MGRDEALLMASDEPVLRVYRWARPQLTIGYFCKWADAQRVAAGRPITRRWTGGGLVEHGADWTFALMIPGRAEPAPELYCRIHQALAEVLRQMGKRAELQAEASGLPGGACFANPVTSDLMCEGQKIAGGAQRRNRRGALHQGSLQLIDLDSDFFERFAAILAQRVETWVPSTPYLMEASRLSAERYSDPTWTKRF